MNKANIPDIQTRIAMAYAAGYSQYRTGFYSKNQFGLVSVIVSAKKSSSINADEVMATLPAGYRPPVDIEVPATLYSISAYGWAPGSIVFTKGGTIIIYKMIHEANAIHATAMFQAVN